MPNIFGKPVIVSFHAVRRLEQRFRLSFASGNFKHPAITKALMLGQLKAAQHCTKWKAVPFYVNKYTSKYKHPIEVYKNGSVIYVVAENPDNFVIVTVVRNWPCE